MIQNIDPERPGTGVARIVTGVDDDGHEAGLAAQRGDLAGAVVAGSGNQITTYTRY